MSYCTLTDIKNLLPEETLIQLTDDENLHPASILASDQQHQAIIGRIDEAIAAADAEIDGYCAGRYSVPFSPVPPVVKGLSVEIAVYYLYKRRTVPERIETSYDKAVARLKDISKGLMTLGVAPPPAAAADGDSVGVNCSAEDRIFTRDTMKGY